MKSGEHDYVVVKRIDNIKLLNHGRQIKIRAAYVRIVVFTTNML